MSDESSKDRRLGHANATKTGAGVPPSPKRGVGVRTVVGLPVIDPEAVRAELGLDPIASRPAAAHAQSVRQAQARSGLAGASARGHREDPMPPGVRAGAEPESDTRYMDPPSEALGRAQTEQMPDALRPTPRPAALEAPEVDMRGSVDMRMRGSVDMRGSIDMRGPGGVDRRDPGDLARERARSIADHAPAQHDAHDAHDAPATGWRRGDGAVPRTRVDLLGDRDHAHGLQSGGSRLEPAAEPEGFRNDVRRALRNSSTSELPDPGNRRAPAAASQSPQNLRLKLDFDAHAQDPRHKSGGKAAVSRVLTWLFTLGLLGGGGAYYIDRHGGLPSVIANLEGLRTGPQTQGAQPGAADPAAATPAPSTTIPVQSPPPSAAATNPNQPAAVGENDPARTGAGVPPTGAANGAPAAQPGQPPADRAAPTAAGTAQAPGTPGDSAQPNGAAAAPPTSGKPEDDTNAQPQGSVAHDNAQAKPARSQATPAAKPRPHATAPKAKPKPSTARATAQRQDPVIQVRPLGDDRPLPPPEPPSPASSLSLDPPAPEER